MLFPDLKMTDMRGPYAMEATTVVIKRGKNGYGFSVVGSNPARIKRVEEGSTAHTAGLCVDDHILRINGQNVARAIADSVAKIVRQSEKQIVLDIERSTAASGLGQDGLPDHHRDHLSGSVCVGLGSGEGQKVNKRVRHALSTIGGSESQGAIRYSIPEENQVVCKVDIEPIPTTASTTTTKCSMTNSLDSLTSLQMCQENLIDIGDWDSPYSSKHSLPTALRSIGYKDLSRQEQDRQAAIQRVVQCEKDFLSQMQFGVQRYSSPLRHEMISPAEHATLFQNVEKLVATSEYHAYKLDEEAMDYSDHASQDKSDRFIDVVGAVYLPKVVTMSEAFEQYCNGIKNAFRLLAELREFEEFEQFLQESSLAAGQPTISGFLRRPLEHIKSLVLNLQRVLSHTSLDHQDIDNLSQVVETMRNACNRINESNTRRSKSMLSLMSRSSSRSSLKSSRSSTKRTKSSSSASSVSPSILSCDSSISNIEASVDPEVMEIQKRLVFCEHVQTFQMATATRHMIYAGELIHVDGLLCTKLYVVLMSDLLLLTKLEPDERLLVVDYPILLHEVSRADFRDMETTDFCLTTEMGVDDEWVEERDVTLRAPSMEQKFTWKNLLEQRTQCCKLQQDFMNMDNFV